MASPDDIAAAIAERTAQQTAAAETKPNLPPQPTTGGAVTGDDILNAIAEREAAAAAGHRRA